jgi:O-antigen/teichoic acid export membrane protein
MGVVVSQSIKNTVITYIGFAIGAANALFMYPHFLGDTFYGLTAFLLSSANIMMPLMAFGVHNTIIKFYSAYKSEREKSQFLTFMLLLPLLLVVPIILAGVLFYDPIAGCLSAKNPIIYDYVWLVPLVGLCMGYFEIFYAWVKVHLKSVLGNFIKEVLLRVLISIFLFGVYFGWVTVVEFVYITVAIYFMAMAAMAVYALRISRPSFSLNLPSNRLALFAYSLFIILSGSVANLLLDIDKVMLGKYIQVENVAYYSVAIFMALVISVPSRAMHQIAHPVTARLMHENRHDELNAFYKRTSLTLQIVGGYVFLGILVNIHAIYDLLPAAYAGGIFVVFTIGLSKYFDLVLGNNNAIIFNSKYYRVVLLLGLLLAICAIGLNYLFIPRLGIDGAAVATLISITLYSLAKLFFVTVKMGLFPFTRQTLYSLTVSGITFVLFYYWEFGFHPLVNIVLKSVLMSVFYAYANYMLKLSPDINAVFDKVIGNFKK